MRKRVLKLNKNGRGGGSSRFLSFYFGGFSLFVFTHVVTFEGDDHIFVVVVCYLISSQPKIPFVIHI